MVYQDNIGPLQADTGIFSCEVAPSLNNEWKKD